MVQEPFNLKADYLSELASQPFSPELVMAGAQMDLSAGGIFFTVAAIAIALTAISSLEVNRRKGPDF